jgi:hypothetical protein
MCWLLAWAAKVLTQCMVWGGCRSGFVTVPAAGRSMGTGPDCDGWVQSYPMTPDIRVGYKAVISSYKFGDIRQSP